MATKWRLFSRNTWTKALVFALAVLLSGATVWLAGAACVYCVGNNIDLNRMFNRDGWIQDAMNDEHELGGMLANNIYSLQSVENIKAGNTVTEAQIVDTLVAYYAEDESFGNGTDGETVLTDEQIDAMSTEIAISAGDYFGDTESVSDFTSWLRSNRLAYQSAKNEEIQQDLDEWNNFSDTLLGDGSDYVYYASSADTGAVVTNVRGKTDAEMQQVKSCPLVYQFDPETRKFSFVCDSGLDSVVGEYTQWYGSSSMNLSSYADQIKNKDVILVGLTQEAYTQYAGASSDAQYRPIWMYLGGMAACLVGVLLCIVVLCAGAGRRLPDSRARLCGFDRIWSEVQVIVVCAVFTFGVIAAGAWISFLYHQKSDVVACLPLAAIGAAVAAICLPCLLSQVRRIKVQKWLDGFVIWKVLRWLAQQWKQGPLFVRVILLAVLIPLCCAFWFTIPFVIAGALYFGIRAAKRLKAVVDGTKRIRAGETDTHIAVEGGVELRQLAEDINSISDGLNHAVDSAVKSERLKSELITNVSHDLKTPLTGIVTYVDLMKQLEPGDPRMQEYLQTVDQKAQRLSTLINDLLDASKASSGAMKTELMRVDFAALFEQACGELQEKLDAAGLQIRVKTEGRTDVCADGRLLWRVLDNLLSNCARYAAPNSRVYVAMQEQGRWCIFTIKNISAVELNISAEELMERFTRGDRARYTEGSGLGLSIAKSLTELMGGTFSLSVDGDLFKTEVFMPLWTQPERPAPENRPPEPPQDVEYTAPLDADFDPEQTQTLPTDDDGTRPL